MVTGLYFRRLNSLLYLDFAHGDLIKNQKENLKKK